MPVKYFSISFFLLCIRNYALRRVRDAFKENKQLNIRSVIQAKLDYGQKNLDIIKRQVNILHKEEIPN